MYTRGRHWPTQWAARCASLHGRWTEIGRVRSSSKWEMIIIIIVSPSYHPSPTPAAEPAVAVVALPHVHWTDGGLVDLSKVSRACADVRAALVVDATQSLGALSFSLSDIRADFVMASTHKWLLGPYGCCPLYCSEEWQRRGQPLEFHEHARAGATSGRDIPFVLPHQAGSGFRGDARAGFGGDAQAGFGMRSFGGGPLVDEEFMNDDVAQLMRRGVASG
eukprot:CAMPEP_0179962474 /NCGR_PEP_ID=MMETSP0983-20121128/30244_1 /TAXON_ID=483367 /ORGANISM="non described non described, Strain CCMP 2436" /LENGTH=219 /DNA_ID=CAMNT_0021874995 /DNA_START=151 /DNA_END=807 /DNA_ORIENTATION=+